MHADEQSSPQMLARWTGWSLIATIVIGILAALFLVQDIDINLSADVARVSDAMFDAELRLRGKAYLAGLLFGLEVLIGLGLFLLLRGSGQLLAAWSLAVSLAASTLALLGAMFAMNAAELASNPAYVDLAADGRLMMMGLQVTSDYTSFHLALILSAIAKAGFFLLFLRSNLIPKIIAGWGLFASLFVAFTIVARDFVPVLGDSTITAAFMLSNLIALVSTGLYLGIWGVRRA
jgi:Domain of unknown function (DUF4386)